HGRIGKAAARFPLALVLTSNPCSQSRMKWFVGALLFLAAAIVFHLGLLAYAMYALLAVMIASRFLARTWAENFVAVRECNKLTANVGETVAVVVTVVNRGPLPVIWA